MSTERGRNPMSESDYPDLIADACEDLTPEVFSRLPLSFFTVPPGGLEETYGQADDRLRRIIGAIDETEVAQHQAAPIDRPIAKIPFSTGRKSSRGEWQKGNRPITRSHT